MKNCVILLLLIIMPCICMANDNCSLLKQTVTFNFYMEGSTSEPNGTNPNDFDPNDFIIVDNYHTDTEVSFTRTGWDIHLSYDKPDGELKVTPDQGLLIGNSDTCVSSIPGGFEFTGAKAGKEIWVLHQNQQGNSLPLGFAAENSVSSSLCPWDPNDPEKGSDSLDKWYKVELVGMRGPKGGHFSLWQISPLRVYISTYKQDIEDIYYINDGSHNHLNWGFSKPGYYELDFEVSTFYSCQPDLYADIWPLDDVFFNGDCKVDLFDFVKLAEFWLESDCVSDSPCKIADIAVSTENIIDFGDLTVLAQQWLDCGYPGCK